MFNTTSIFSGLWYISDEYMKLHAPIIMSMMGGNSLKLHQEEIPTGIISSTLSDFKLNQAGTLSRLYINDTEYIGVVKFHSAITKDDTFCGPRGTTTVADVVTRWSSDANCIGLLQSHDSGGGEVSGTRRAARAFKETFTKPSASHVFGLCASASLYLASSSDKIFMDKDADMVGSIGVLHYSIDLFPILEAQGAKKHIVLADGSEDKIKAQLEAAKGNYAALKKESINPAKEDFHNWMKDVRPNIKEETLTGNMYHLDQAIDKGLVDQEGTFLDAVNYIIEQHNANQVNNQSNTNMSAENNAFPTLAKALGTPISLKGGGLFGLGKAVELSADQIQTLEQTLTEAVRIEGRLKASEEENTGLKAKLNDATKEANATLIAGIKSLGLEAKESLEENATLLANTAKEYGSQPGETPTNPELTPQEPEAKGEFDYVDFNADHYENL